MPAHACAVSAAVSANTLSVYCLGTSAYLLCFGLSVSVDSGFFLLTKFCLIAPACLLSLRAIATHTVRRLLDALIYLKLS